MSHHETALHWAIHYLTSKSYSIGEYQKIIETSYSVVYKLETSQSRLFLKQTPKELFLEPDTLAFLNQHDCPHVPKYIAQNKELRCFIMTSVGELSLRQQFKGTIQLEQVIRGILNFTSIQRSLEKNLDELLKLGTLDWLLNKFPSLYLQLIEQDTLLIEDGLNHQELERLQHLYRKCISICDELSSYNVPETINHCDFHENNMVLDIIRFF